jgi:hypothetical protein
VPGHCSKRFNTVRKNSDFGWRFSAALSVAA